jgi:hypothetical protein
MTGSIMADGCRANFQLESCAAHGYRLPGFGHAKVDGNRPSAVELWQGRELPERFQANRSVAPWQTC